MFPPKNPHLRQRHLSRPLMEEGIHVLRRLVFTFLKQRLTVQKDAVTDWQSLCLVTQNMGIMTVAVTQRSHIPTLCVKAEQKEAVLCKSNGLLTHWPLVVCLEAVWIWRWGLKRIPACVMENYRLGDTRKMGEGIHLLAKCRNHRVDQSKQLG